MPGVWVDLEDAYSSGGGGGGLAGWYANNGNGLAPESDAPRVHLQAWILLKPKAELAQRPPANPPPDAPRQPQAAMAGNGTVSC